METHWKPLLLSEPCHPSLYYGYKWVFSDAFRKEYVLLIIEFCVGVYGEVYPFKHPNSLANHANCLLVNSLPL